MTECQDAGTATMDVGAVVEVHHRTWLVRRAELGVDSQLVAIQDSSELVADARAVDPLS